MPWRFLKIAATPTSILLALCVIMREDQVLLLQREREPYRGYWGLPGGKFAFGEDVAAAALREGREETGLELALNRIRGVATEVIAGPDGSPEAHFVMFVVDLAPVGGRLSASEEGRLRWTPLSAIGERDIIPSDRWMLDHFVLCQGQLAVPHLCVQRSQTGRYELCSTDTASRGAPLTRT